MPTDDTKIKAEKSKIITDNLNNIINLYSVSCSRIVETFSGALLVELEHKTLYFNSNGINEFNLSVNVGIMPDEDILIVKKDKKINSIQKQKLEGSSLKNTLSEKVMLI